MTRFQTISALQDNRIVIVTINRPRTLNALNSAVMLELSDLFEAIDHDPSVSVAILTGEGRAFATGIGTPEMQSKRFTGMYLEDYLAGWRKFASHRKPVIAAVNGLTLGSGCELALMCDLIIASDRAEFGQPEVKPGSAAGIGGSVSLSRAIGKAKAMDLVFTGRTIDAKEADQIGLVSRIVPHDILLKSARQIAGKLAAMPQASLINAKQLVDRALVATKPDAANTRRLACMGLFETCEPNGLAVSRRAQQQPDFLDD